MFSKISRYRKLDDVVVPDSSGRLAASKALHIYRGDVPVEQLDLAGSGAAVAELRRCVGIHATKPATGAREKGRSDRIPRDPFAPDAKPGSGD